MTQGHPEVAALRQVVDDLIDVMVVGQLPVLVKRATAEALRAAAAAHSLAEATTEGFLDEIGPA